MSGQKHNDHAPPVSWEEDEVFDDGHLRVEHLNYFVSCGGDELTLSRKEFLLTSIFTRHAGQVVRTDEIWRYVWGDDAPFNDNTFKVHVHRLRRRLLPFGIHLENELNTGYRLLPVQKVGTVGRRENHNSRPPAPGAPRTAIGNRHDKTSANHRR